MLLCSGRQKPSFKKKQTKKTKLPTIRLRNSLFSDAPVATEITTSRSPDWLLLISPAEAPSDQRHAANKLSQPLGGTVARPEGKKERGEKREKEPPPPPPLCLTLSGSINDQMEAICVTTLTALTGRQLTPPTYCIQMSQERPRRRKDGWMGGW